MNLVSDIAFALRSLARAPELVMFDSHGSHMGNNRENSFSYEVHQQNTVKPAGARPDCDAHRRVYRRTRADRHVDVRISHLQRYMDQRFTDTTARLEALIRAEI